MECLWLTFNIILNFCGNLRRLRQNVRTSVTEASLAVCSRWLFLTLYLVLQFMWHRIDPKNISDEIFFTRLPHYPVPSTRQPSICRYILPLFLRNSWTFRLIWTFAINIGLARSIGLFRCSAVCLLSVYFLLYLASFFFILPLVAFRLYFLFLLFSSSSFFFSILSSLALFHSVNFCIRLVPMQKLTEIT